jgi:hypothetical protein
MGATHKSHSLQPIPVVERFVRDHGRETITPVVSQHFKPSDGWRLHGWRKRISISYARRLRREGVTCVGLEVAPGRIADFRIEELLSSRANELARQQLADAQAGAAQKARGDGRGDA